LKAISEQTFASAHELERGLIEAALKDTLVLTETSRLARRVLHCFRMERIRQGEKGWRTPAVLSFNRWVKNTFDRLWQPNRPLSRLGSLRLWQEATLRVPPPEGLNLGPSLYLQLQETFDLLTRHGQDFAGPPKGQILADWRREVSRHFLNLLNIHQFVPWTGLLDTVRKAVEEGKVVLPATIVLAGFDEFSPAEQALVQGLGKKSKLSLWLAEQRPGKETEVLVYATPDQECQAVCAEVLREWNRGKKNLGVVFLDSDYFERIRRCLEEMTDREERPSDGLRYNLTFGRPFLPILFFKRPWFPSVSWRTPCPDNFFRLSWSLPI